MRYYLEEYAEFVQEGRRFAYPFKEEADSNRKKLSIVNVIREAGTLTVNFHSIEEAIFTTSPLKDIDPLAYPLEFSVLTLLSRTLKRDYVCTFSFMGFGRFSLDIRPPRGFTITHLKALFYRLGLNVSEENFIPLLLKLKEEGFIDLSVDAIVKDEILKRPLTELILRLTHGKLTRCLWCGENIIKPWGESGVYCGERCYIRLNERIRKLNNNRMPEVIDENGNSVSLQKYMENKYLAYTTSGGPQAYEEFWEKEAPRLEKEFRCKLKTQYGYIPNVRKRNKTF